MRTYFHFFNVSGDRLTRVTNEKLSGCKVYIKYNGYLLALRLEKCRFRTNLILSLWFIYLDILHAKIDTVEDCQIIDL